MWPRAVEVMLALWLLLSPFIFGHYPDQQVLWLTDFLAAALIILLALAALSRRLHRLYLLELPIAIYLIILGYFHGGYPSTPSHQNEIFVGLTLILFAIIPTEANLPPRKYREFYLQKSQKS